MQSMSLMAARPIAMHALTTALILALWAFPAPRAAGETIARSVNEFSGVQGQGNWYYGYYEGLFNPAGFALMTTFDSGANVWYVDPAPPSPFVWTSLYPTGGHPNGTISTSGRDRVEQWAVRRWISEFTGPIRITGALADQDGTIGNANGAAGRIFVGDSEVFHAAIDNGDFTGVNFSVTRLVASGTAIDFAIDPIGANELSDSTRFTARIESLPAGDIDLDGDVDRTDAALFSQHLGTASGAVWATGDFDGDEATTLADMALLQAHLSQAGGQAALASAVPEPSAILLAACGLFVAAPRCFGRRRA